MGLVSPRAAKVSLAEVFAALHALDGGERQAALAAQFAAQPVTCRVCRIPIALEGVHWVCRCAYPTLDPRELAKTLAVGPLAARAA